MKNLFALIGFATIAFVGLGWYLGWYSITRQPGAPGTQRFALEVIPAKVSGDVKKGAERVGQIYEKLTEEAPAAQAKADAADATRTEAAPVTQLFTAPSAKPQTGPKWNSLEFMPPPLINGGQPVVATPSSR